MSKKRLKIAVILGAVGFIAMAFSGCALLPYSSNYSCPEAKSDMGNCSSLITNYKASLHPALYAKLENQKKAKVNCPVSLEHTKACEGMGIGAAKQVAVFKNNNVSFNKSMSVSQYLIKYMIKTSAPPLYIPAVIKKIWILPYSSKKTFHSGQDIFVVVRSGRWLYGNYLFKKYDSNKFNLFKITR